MDIFRNPYSDDTNDLSQTARSILIGVALSILILMAVIIYFYYLSGLKTEIIIIGVGTVPILIALELARENRIQVAGFIISFSLTIMVTILATIGQGINDIGMMAFPAILLIASLILRREITVSLTFFMILCSAWLVYGNIYHFYQPVYLDHLTYRPFVVSSLILVITSSAVLLISSLIQKGLQTTRKELQERRRIEKELRDAETMYRALVEETSVVVYRDAPDVSGATIYISPQIETLLGYSREEWKRNPLIWKEFTHPDDMPSVMAGIAGQVTTGEPAQLEYRLQTKGGEWKWVRDEAVVIRDEQGKLQYVQGVLIDITERKEAEEKVRQHEAVLGTVAYMSQQLLKGTDWRSDIQNILARLGESTGASHVYIFENRTGEEVPYASMLYEWVAPGMQPDINIAAYQHSRLIASPGLEDWYSFLSAGKPFYGSAKQYPRYWERVFKERGLKTLLEMPIYVNGRWWGIIGFDDYVHEMPWSQAEIDALVAAASNLGTAIERQIKVDELKTSEEKFHLAFHHTYVAMAISRASDSRLLDVNQAFCNVTQFSREEAIGNRAGRDLNIWISQENRNHIFTALKEHSFIDEYKCGFRRKNGEIGVGLVSAVNISVGGEACQLFSFYDISQIERLLDELKAKNEELQSFTYTVSHDLKSPLVTIAGFLGYLEQDARKGDIERLNKDILRINEAASKMQRLLNELLELSRIGRLMNPPVVVPFEEIVREALSLVEGRLQARQVKVQVKAGLPSIYGDRVRLVEIVQNLVDNSCRFMGDQADPRIDIGVEIQGIRSVLFVRDNGMGIEPEYQERIFGLFNKLDANSEGTGIGLALVKRIVEVHGGKIWVESQGKGKGSTFYFTLADKPATDTDSQ
ncbi:MAG: PAS domain S-box protein [Anaerolineales bacterium]